MYIIILFNAHTTWSYSSSSGFMVMLAIRKIVSFQGASQRAVLYSLLSGCGISGLRTLTNSASGRRSLYIAAITCSNGKSNKPKSSQSNEHESVFMQVLGKKEQPKQMTVGVKGSRISIILMLLFTGCHNIAAIPIL